MKDDYNTTITTTKLIFLLLSWSFSQCYDTAGLAAIKVSIL